MISQEIKDKITDLLYGELPDQEAMALREAIDADPELAREYEENKNMVQTLQGLQIYKAGADSSLRFKQWLDVQAREANVANRQSNTRRINIWKYGVAASILLVLGIFIGQKLVKESLSLAVEAKSKESLLQLVANESTTSRIEGINRSLDLKNLDPEVRDVLLSLLVNDKSTNVRLAALDALSVYTQDPVIKSTLIKLLKDDSQPIVQISIINALVKFKERDVKESLEDLISQEGLTDDVRDEAILSITRL